MFKKIRQTQYIEEILGMIGLVIALVLFVLSAFLMRFLIGLAPENITATASIAADIPVFEIEKAKEALTQR